VAQADTAALKDCQDADKTIVTIGLTNHHRALATMSPGAAGATTIANKSSCAAFAFGNDYQMLDWLENGKIDAAIVSPFVAEIIAQRGIVPLGQFFGMTTVWPFSAASLPTYHVTLQVLGPDGPGVDAAAAFDEVIRGMDAPGGPRAQIVVDSYLSAALPILLDYIEDRRKTIAPQTSDSQRFWRELLQRVVLSHDGADIAATAKITTVVVKSQRVSESDQSTLLLSENSLQEVFVFRDALRKELGVNNQSPTPFVWRAYTIPAWLRNAASHASDIDKALYALLDDTYAVQEEGFRKHRHFRFNLNELWHLLNTSGKTDDGLALILTGGGVKAVYQSRMIDHLYGKGNYLTNSTELPLSSKKPIRVDHVIGTSGGALLGTFVAAIAGDEQTDLSQALWRNPEGNYVDSFDVFPFFEMPRYLSFLVAGLLFSLLIFVSRRVPGLRNWTEATTFPGKYQLQEQLQTYLPPRALWFILLAVAPWIIKSVNGVKGLEHVPAIAGIFYFLCLLIFIVADNRLIFKPSFRWANISFGGSALVMLISGILMALMPLAGQLTTSFELKIADLGEITLATLLCCIGMVLVAVSIYLGLRSATDDMVKVEWRLLIRALSVLFLVPLLATIMVWLTGQSLFEFSAEFWNSFILWSLVITIVLVAVSHLPNIPPERNFIKTGLDFLMSDFPTLTFMMRLRRYLRITGLAALTFLYWNIVMAPAIYGNEQAKELFTYTYGKLVCAPDTTQEQCLASLEQPLSKPPVTNFVVSATSLENKRERYFVFHPDKIRRGTSTALPSPDSTGLLEELVKKDPRWIAADADVTQQQMLNIVFASGSPFPIFPATRAGLADTNEQNEWLVDGGYAHNVPIEAAQLLGANTVLVISSSPLHQHRDVKRRMSRFNVVGKLGLVENLPRLFPYLFERSQVEDALSAEKMLVTTISPVPRENWPSLMDFKSEVVEDLLDAAEADIPRRIGMFESWGKPVCKFGSVLYDCQALKELKFDR